MQVFFLDPVADQKTSAAFSFDNVRPAMNMHSGFVFLVNDGYQVAMLNNQKLEIFHTLPYSGAEGFLEDLFAENHPNDLHQEDIDYMLSVTVADSLSLPVSWIEDRKSNSYDLTLE